jgi:putative acyl-CoA dehydrogenase
MLRAMQREPGSLETFMAEVQLAAGANQYLDQYAAQLAREFADLADIEYRARSIVEKMALALQGSLLVRHGNPAVADAFCASRLSGLSSGLVYGNLPRGVDCAAIVKRATAG